MAQQRRNEKGRGNMTSRALAHRPMSPARLFLLGLLPSRARVRFTEHFRDSKAGRRSQFRPVDSLDAPERPTIDDIHPWKGFHRAKIGLFKSVHSQ